MLVGTAQAEVDGGRGRVDTYKAQQIEPPGRQPLWHYHGVSKMHGSDALQGLDTALAEAMSGSERFGHREHVHLAWLVCQTEPTDAGDVLCSWLREIAETHSMPERFHRTLTLAWVELTKHHLARDPGEGGFAGFIGRHPGLLDSALPASHWERETLSGQLAREKWVSPDRVPLPT